MSTQKDRGYAAWRAIRYFYAVMVAMMLASAILHMVTYRQFSFLAIGLTLMLAPAAAAIKLAEFRKGAK